MLGGMRKLDVGARQDIFFLQNRIFFMKQRASPPTEFDLDLILATQTAEREAQLTYERQSLHPAFGRGYDSERWPFDIRRCIASAGYRAGILRAVVNTFYNRQWRAAASYELFNIVFPAVRERELQAERIINSARRYYMNE